TTPRIRDIDGTQRRHYVARRITRPLDQKSGPLRSRLETVDFNDGLSLPTQPGAEGRLTTAGTRTHRTQRYRHRLRLLDRFHLRLYFHLCLRNLDGIRRHGNL